MKLNIRIVAATTLAGLLFVGCNQQANSTGMSAAVSEDPATQSLAQAAAPASTNDVTASNNPATDQPTNTTNGSGLREADIATSTNDIPTAPPMPVTPQ